MELNKIENLLDKYFDGNTSIDEENKLKVYFSQDDIPAHLQDYKAMFAYFAQNKEETSSQPIQVKTKKRTWRVNWLAASVAAVLLIFISTIYISPTSNGGELSKIEQEEAQKAFEDTKKAFQLISKNLNKGNKAIAYLDKFESTKNKIFK